jgi:DNA-binding transcriptional LysR family regulator
MLNLRQIEVFRAVMDTGSMTDAARLLHVSQPGVSRLVHHLELRLGVALFDRRRGRLHPTPEARTLHAEIERVYRGVRQVQDVAAHLRHGADAPLRVLASANVSLQLLPRAIAALIRLQPRARVSFEVLPPREIATRLISEEADLAFSSASIDHPSLKVQEIGQWRLLCALPAAHRLARRRTLELGNVLQERLVVYGADAPQSAAIDRWLEQHASSRHVAVEVRSGYAACAMAAAGAGIAFVDDLSARAHRPEGLVFRQLPLAPRFPVYSVFNVNRPLSALGCLLLDLATKGILEITQGLLPGER